MTQCFHTLLPHKNKIKPHKTQTLTLSHKTKVRKKTTQTGKVGRKDLITGLLSAMIQMKEKLFSKDNYIFT